MSRELNNHEMMKELMESPNKKFISEDLTAYIEKGCIKFRYGNDEWVVGTLSVNRIWEEEVQSVDPYEAIKSYVEKGAGFIVKNQYGTTVYSQESSYKLGANSINYEDYMDRRLFRPECKWYITE